MIRASIVGGAGYAGGELTRLLLDHPHMELTQVTSARLGGRFVHSVHPNLRARTELRFVAPEDLGPCDVLFLALPHGAAAQKIEHYAALAERIVDLSADFRLNDPADYSKWYGEEHPAPEWLERFVYGLPETSRDELAGARYASGVGCNATATNLALLPLARSQVIERVVVEVKVGSSEGGAKSGPASHHPERSGCLRSFAPTGHRHQAEILQVLGDIELHFSATSVEMVRGVLCTAHVFLNDDLNEKDAWRLYREFYGAEPFVRIVKERNGLYRYPEPKLLGGTNYCDVGFERDPASNRLVVFSAIDNLMKGAAGSAVQTMNLMCGLEETAGLGFSGLHPC
ncbi:MAG: N-acetyl-gamma-glutamyl-phosphate/LysW-gamma-L-alpha-aminoadipyl-6-phosphate reductase [Planctomycetota bacterium]|jgi:N-acetyl-gamma-glutamyl-phosphate/LysW-gamma-L-alpha-aminoadipyl-6-phosphate reductase